MAPATKDTIGFGDEKFNWLKEAFKCTSGTIDFERLAPTLGSPNAEAARKKFKRLFEKDDTPLALSGSTLGNGEAVTQATRTSKTTAKSGDNGADASKSAAKTKSGTKKRKTADIAEEDEIELKEVEDSATPKKKVKTTQTPKSPKTPKTPRAPRTPKGAGVDSPKHPEIEESTDDHKNGAVRTGSPEVQAKVDGIVKHNEKNGVEVGDAEKQAIHDGVEKELTAAEKK